MALRRRLLTLAAFLGLSLSCGGESGGDETTCLPGREGCPCDMGVCLAGLSCLSDLCVDESASGGTMETTESSTTMDPSETDTSETSTTTSDMCDPGELLCDGECIDPMSNDDHCGACGFGCMISDASGGGSLGGCLDGECQPFWSGCNPPEDPYDCNQVCFDLGALCAPASCDGLTMSYYPADMSCEIFNSAGSYANGCIQAPINTISGIYRCCCQQ